MGITYRAPNACRLFRVGLPVCVLLLAGCCTPNPPPADLPSQVRLDPPNSTTAADYAVVFPDVVEITVAGRPDCPGLVLVGPDGRIDLGPYGTVFAEGATAVELAGRIAQAACVSPADVRCQVTARSRVVHVLGTGAGRPRSVPYAGPERVTELLERAGGLAERSDASSVRIVRRNVARGTPTETFQVDLAAIRRGDTRTDLVIEPNDEVHLAGDRGVALAGFVSAFRRP